MSDIDRIAFSAAAKYFGYTPTISLESIIRAALLEYGAIVREECAKVCDENADFFGDKPSEEMHILHARERETSRDLALAIRSRINANKG